MSEFERAMKAAERISHACGIFGVVESMWRVAPMLDSASSASWQLTQC
jgi:hypothetical protein